METTSADKQLSHVGVEHSDEDDQYFECDDETDQPNGEARLGRIEDVATSSSSGDSCSDCSGNSRLVNNGCFNNGVTIHSKPTNWRGRSSLPATMVSRTDFSLWSFLKQCIGKELSKITMPIVFNEPISFLQRIVEYMEYATSLVERACESTDPIERMELVTAFAVSATASNWERIGKPFNPLLGETYELDRWDDLGFRIVCEQVEHHPPISAFHVEARGYSFHGTIYPKIKFWGSSVQVTPKGLVTLHLNRHNETYSWQNVSCSVHNVIVGRIWVEHYGEMEVTNWTTKHRSVLTFKPCGWTGTELHKVQGYMCDSRKKKLRYFYGKWIEALYSCDVEQWEKAARTSWRETDSPADQEEPTELPQVRSSSCNLNIPGQKLLWMATPKPENSSRYYNFTLLAMMLNELDPRQKAILAPTDCRLRPDLRLLEQADVENASAEKNRLEEKQRRIRKERAKAKEEWKPRWFRYGKNPSNGIEEWLFTGTYWKRDWTNCPDIY